MIKKTDKNKLRQKKHMRIRNKISGTPARPRLNVYKSNKNIYAQIIDDMAGVTLVAASSLDTALKNEVPYGGNKNAAKEVGKLIAKRAVEKGIKAIVFDRGGYIYHGRVKELADAARAEGLEF
ncbi:MAG: 50S ribosomal protein L18 [Clostridia bacterium]